MTREDSIREATEDVAANIARWVAALCVRYDRTDDALLMLDQVAARIENAKRALSPLYGRERRVHE